MDLLERQEIYIPEDAEVKSIPLHSLPNSVQRRIGLSVSDSDGSKRLTDSAVGVWICPAILRQKGQKQTSNQGNCHFDSLSSKIAKDGAPGPFQVSFVSSNKAAHKVLKETLHGADVSADTSSTAVLPPGLAPQTYQVAVIIYQGRVYLSIRKRSRSKNRGETKDPPAASEPIKPAIPSTPVTSADGPKKPVAPQASLKPANKKPQKKRLRVILTPRSKPTTTTTTRQQELQNSLQADGSLSSSREAHSGDGKDTSSSRSAPSAPRSSDGALGPSILDAGEKQRAEDPAGRILQESDQAGGEDARSPSQDDDMDVDGGRDRESWSCREFRRVGVECDFKELAQEEKIARIKAQLQQSEALLKNLNSSK